MRFLWTPNMKSDDKITFTSVWNLMMSNFKWINYKFQRGAACVKRWATSLVIYLKFHHFRSFQVQKIFLLFLYSLNQGSASLKIWPVPSIHQYPKKFSGRYPVPIGTQKNFWLVPYTQRYPSSEIFSVSKIFKFWWVPNRMLPLIWTSWTFRLKIWYGHS